MALGSSIKDALPPTIEKLRQQLAGLSPKAVQAVQSAADVPRPALLQQALDNAPLLMELGTTLLSRLRGVRDRPADPSTPVPVPRRRSRLQRPIVIGIAVFGALYLLSVAGRSRAANARSMRRM